MNARDWCCAENAQFGVGLIQPDSALVEFDRIHPDKTDYGEPGEGSAMYVYLANDWLQMHAWGGDDMNFRFRFAIASYACEGKKPGYALADLGGMAERLQYPPLQVRAGTKAGGDFSGSFLRTAEGVSLVGLKRAEDGHGLIARLYAPYGESPFGGALRGGLLPIRDCARNTPDEEAMREAESEPFSGFATLRLNAGDRIAAESPAAEDPFVIGGGYTGLLRRLRGARGENRGQIYLLWGAVQSDELKYYQVFRAEVPGLAGGEGTLIGEAQPEDFVVGRYVDEGLRDDTVYYYRVRAVRKDGGEGPLSEETAVHTLQI